MPRTVHHRMKRLLPAALLAVFGLSACTDSSQPGGAVGPDLEARMEIRDVSDGRAHHPLQATASRGH